MTSLLVSNFVLSVSHKMSRVESGIELWLFLRNFLLTFWYLHIRTCCSVMIAKQVVFGRAYRGLTGGFLLLRNFSVTVFVSPHVCSILVLILISIFLR